MRRRGLRLGLCGGLLGVLVLFSGHPVHGQARGERERARFREAVGMAVDPKGRLYVVDAGRDMVQILDLGGSTGSTLGGAGTRTGEFDGPADVDPTNGLTVLVADAGNGRLQRFSEEGQFLEAIPIGPAFRRGAEHRFFEDGRDGSDIRGDGRPIAVESTSSNEIFVIDGRDDVVVKFGAQRRFEGTVGGGLGTAGTLRNPVDLATGSNRRLYVADGVTGRILVYDFLGTFVRQLPIAPVENVRHLTWIRNRLWIVCRDRVLISDPTTGTIQTRRVDLDEPLIDAVRWQGAIYLLTSTRLLQRTGW